MNSVGNYTLWQYGGYATTGLKELAEYGVIRTLEQEIKNHVKKGKKIKILLILSY